MDRRGWYLDKGMNPVYVGALITILMASMTFFRYLDNGQTKQDEKIESNEKRVSGLEDRTRADMKEIRDTLNQILQNQERRK